MTERLRSVGQMLGLWRRRDHGDEVDGERAVDRGVEQVMMSSSEVDGGHVKRFPRCSRQALMPRCSRRLWGKVLEV